MALVIRRSKIHADGVYTTRPIRKRSIVAEYTGPRLTKAEADDLYEDSSGTYLFGLTDGEQVIDGDGIAAFINHSCDPNCEADEIRGRVFIRAIRDIAAGEELVYDYNLYDGALDDPAPCFCRTSKCRGSMYSEAELAKRKKAEEKPGGAEDFGDPPAETTSLDSYTELGQTHMCLHHYREAISAYEHGAAIEPNNLVCIYNMGYALSRLGDDHAADYFLRAIGAWEQMEHSSPTRRSLANQYSAMSHAYMGVGRPQEAVAALEKALAITKTVRPARLFSSTKYVLVSNSEFVAEIQELLVKAREAVRRKDGRMSRNRNGGNGRGKRANGKIVANGRGAGGRGADRSRGHSQN